MGQFFQGGLDSLCGVYSIINAERLINGSSDDDSQNLFNDIIRYLSKKRLLKDTIIDGMDHRTFTKIMTDIIGEKIPCQITNRKNITKLSEWWLYAKSHLSIPDTVIVLSLDGRESHYATVQSMTDRAMKLYDAGGIKTIRRSSCKLKGYVGEDKYVIFPFQCWFLGKNNP